MPEVILHQIHFNELPDQVKEKVVVTFRGWLFDVYKIIVMKRQIGQMFNELNTIIEFYKDDQGRKLFRVDDSGEQMGRFLGDQFARASKWDPNIMDKILINMMKRNDGEERLKIK